MSFVQSATAPRVAVVGLGGTIAMAQGSSGGVIPSLSAEDLVAAVPGLAGLGVDLDVHSFCSRPGASLTVEDIFELSDTLMRRFTDGAVGAVITQGTDTIEETAYLLDLLNAAGSPIVVTGAMRNPTLAGADGPANLLAAVTVAASPDARGLGCLVVLADEIHAAARVRKSHTTSPSTFVSSNGGPLGYVVEGHVRLVNRPAHHYRPATPDRGRPLPRVGLYSATLGDDGSLLPLLASQIDGLVIAAFGVGHVPETWVAHLAEIADRIPVVLASRTGAGFTATNTYGFAGSERDLIARGLIPAGILDPYKARLLLQVLLAATDDRASLTAAVAAATGNTGSGAE
ncbi:asparaginase [Paractinoplanes ferrugineus]|uniref:L-asparaginase n=1 Tax=Paractinoplanes ferrugineus TaxID=113564 RepID=A0A919J5Z7_9ACTN|nr:asparaginase [Actinoplanes ferrugineus]GIE14219.1 L-asparaginase [Actinoplanes ferrugineus]